MHSGLNLPLLRKKVVLLLSLTGPLTSPMPRDLPLSSFQSTLMDAEKPMVVMVVVVRLKDG